MCSNTLKVCNNNPLSLVLKTFSPNLSFDFSNDIVEHIRNLIFVVNHLFISLRSLKWSKVKWSRSVVSDSATPWTVAYQAPPSMEFSRQDYWSGLPSPSPGIFPTQGSNLGLPHYRHTLYCLSHQGSPKISEVPSFLISLFLYFHFYFPPVL